MQKVINKALQSYLNRFAIINMDDILVYSDTRDDHVKHVVRDLVKKYRKVRNMGLSSLRRLFANIYDLGRYTRRTTKS